MEDGDHILSMQNVLSAIKWSVCITIMLVGDIYSRTLVHAPAHHTNFEGQRVNSKDLVRSLLLEPVLFFVVLLILRAMCFTTLEVVWPAR